MIFYAFIVWSGFDKILHILQRRFRNLIQTNKLMYKSIEFVAYFLYHPYNKEKIIQFLEENTSWRVKAKQKEHYDCEIHNAAKYIYQCAEGRPHGLPELSVQVRAGELTKQEARKILDEQTYEKEPSAELNRLCDYVGLSKRALLTKAKIYRWLPKWIS